MKKSELKIGINCALSQIEKTNFSLTFSNPRAKLNLFGEAQTPGKNNEY